MKFSCEERLFWKSARGDRGMIVAEAQLKFLGENQHESLQARGGIEL